jgi:hypothetical protein
VFLFQTRKEKIMAIVFEANYSKKLGLPGYSSHQYSLTVRAELSDLGQVEAESKRLYGLLQGSVDREIQQIGFLPQGNGNGQRPVTNGNGHTHNANGKEEKWNCSDKQRELILKIVDEHKLDKNQVENLAQERFGKSVRMLNKLEASGLIEELFRQTGGNKPNGNRRFQPMGAK